MTIESQAVVKPTELFVSDMHGEYEAFSHVLRSGCGAVRHQVDALFGEELPEQDRAVLATLVCYPQRKMQLELAQAADGSAWLTETAGRLGMLLARFASLRTEEELQIAVAGDFAEDLQAIAALDAAAAQERAQGAASEAFVEALCIAIQRLAAGRLHMVGDVYDRGPAPDLIMDELLKYPAIDIQWGNHDMLWMGASLGQPGCVANVVRICSRYGNLSILEETYGIDLEPLKNFALTAYADDPCAAFGLKGSPTISEEAQAVSVKVQKAMSFIQFKVEHKLIAENPSFGLESRDLLHRIDYEAGTVELDGVVHELTDKVFPTIDPADPYRMTPEEEHVMDSLQQAFLGCERLQRHIALFLEKGSLYRICGDTLAYHACVPLNADGTCKEVTIFGETLHGRSLCDAVERYVRDAFVATDPVSRKRGLDFLWYLWLGEGSPLFAKSKMATFELYLIADKAARKEVKNPYYSLLNDADVIAGIFREFGMDPETSRIVSGHVPVKVKDGEDPVKCDGKALVIDGGMSKAYQKTTGIAGMALVYNEEGQRLATLSPFPGTQAAIEDNLEIGISWRPLA
ncbi:MAG: fructose-1,6-bisphosphatase [Eggerthellaceae bacterium]|nr:fructose-1,6-bisphosphatase [Eggerthellaceae bacterium]